MVDYLVGQPTLFDGPDGDERELYAVLYAIAERAAPSDAHELRLTSDDRDRLEEYATSIGTTPVLACRDLTLGPFDVSQTAKKTGHEFAVTTDLGVESDDSIPTEQFEPTYRFFTEAKVTYL